jgi:hypothetical protein
MTYRESRNIEASLREYLTTNLNVDYPTVACEIGYRNLDGDDLPIVLVRLSDTIHERIEVGTISTRRLPLVLIDIYAATGDGQRLDLKDYLISKLKGQITYKEYTVTGNVATSVANGTMMVTNIEDTPVDFNIDKSELNKVDRYRHLLSLSINLQRVET